MQLREDSPPSVGHTRCGWHALMCYSTMSFVAFSVTIVGLTMEELAPLAGVDGPLDLHQVYFGRGAGALGGTLLGGWLCDRFPMKVVMSVCIVWASLGSAMVPMVARAGTQLLSAYWGLISLATSALASSTVTAACSAFPGAQVAPVLSGCAMSIALAAAVLPLLLWPWRGDAVAEYSVVACCGFPVLAIVQISAFPARRSQHSVSAGGEPKASASGKHKRIKDWLVAYLAGAAQLVIQGSNTALVQWLTYFAKHELHEQKGATLLVTTFQSAVTAGCFLAACYQPYFVLWGLARGQFALVVAGLVAWAQCADTLATAMLATVWYGFVGGPTLTCCSALYNQYTEPTASQLAIISLGSNLGANLGPAAMGYAMKKYGASVLPVALLATNGLVLVGFLSVDGSSICCRGKVRSQMDRLQESLTLTA